MSSGWSSIITGTRSTSRSVRSSVRLVHPAWLCVIAALGLSLLGVYGIDVANASTSHSLRELAPQAWKQVVFLVIGMIAAVTAALPHLRWLSLLSWTMAAGALGLLILLLMPGVPDWLVSPINGTRSWLKLPGFNAQPSELAKISFVMVIATLMRRNDRHRTFLGVVRLFLLAAVPVGLIAIQPDLGTASLFVPSLVAMLIAGGAKLRHLVILAVLGVSLAPACWPLLRDYQQQRIVSLWRSIQGDRSGAQDENYQSFTAQRLIGAGGIHGQGDAHTRALIRFNRLPEAHNDMIYAVLVCRFGLVGSVFLLAGYGVWLGGALLTAVWTKDPFGRIVAVGMSAFIAGQAVINIGMNIGLVPIIGITLPFVSYGGSSLLTCWIMTGLLVNIAMRRPVPPIRPSFEYAHDDAPPRR